MIRQSLLFLSDSAAARKVVTESSVSRRLAQRFVAGDTLNDAVRAAHELNEVGLKVSLDYLGEDVTSDAEAIAAAAMAVESLERIAREGIDGNISLKPTQLGLRTSEALCIGNVERVLTRARELGDGAGEIFVRLDMEGSEFTEGTLSLIEALWERGYRNVGTVVQSYLHRAPDDIRRLNQLGSRVRLVKGAYREPSEVAYQDKADVDRMFFEGIKLLLDGGVYPAIATHDEELIAATRRFAFEHGIARDSFEFQMLYGIRRDLQQRLREEGYKVRIYLPYGDSWYPYLMRRVAERPANLLFVASSIAKESPLGHVNRPVALGAGMVTGAVATMMWQNRNSK